MARQIIVSILGDASKFNKATADATGAAGKFGNVLQGIGQGIGISAFTNISNVAGMAAGAIVDYVNDSIDAASNLREAMALTDQVFEGTSDRVVAWGETAAQTMGASQREALDMAAVFGNAFKNVGFSLDETADKSIELSELAGDLGSAFNKSSEEAATALRSGLLGESEPLRKFGVFLDEAKVKAKALSMGMKPVNGAFTDGQKVLARYQLILEQTADSQGMFGRDSESLADTQKMLDAELENLSATVGTMLLPYMVQFTKYLSSEVVPALQDMAEWIEENGWLLDGFATGVAMFVQGPANALEGKLEDTNRALAQQKLDAWATAAAIDGPLSESFQQMVADAKASAGAFDTAGGATVDFEGYLKELRDEANKTTSATRDLIDATEDWFNEIDGAAEPDILRGELAELNGELREQRRHLAELEAIKNPTKAQREDILITRGTIAGINADIDKTIIKLGRLDGASAKDIRATLATLRKNGIEPAKDEAIALYNALLKALGISYRLDDSGKKKFPGKAKGGPASGMTWVGEEGPELVNLPAGSYVHNNRESVQMAEGRGGRSTGTPMRGSGGFTIIVQGDVYGDGIDALADKLAMRLRLAGA